MRVSTSQFFQRSSDNISHLQSGLSEQTKYLSSGKQVLTAKDAPTTNNNLLGMKEGLRELGKYNANIIQAENRNSLLETKFSNATDLLQNLKQTFIQAQNGTLIDSDLNTLADIAENNLQQMLDLANSKDETGGYVFSGYQTDVAPFLIQSDNQVSYQGDGGSRALKVAANVMVDTSQSGFDAFEKIPNVKGDFSPLYISNTSGISVTTAKVVDRNSYDSVTNPPDYNFSFTSSTDLNVTDSLGNTLFTSAAYVPGQIIAFNGVEVQINGNPLPGDNFDLIPDENISVFDNIKNAIDWMRSGVNGDSVAYHDTLAQLASSLNKMIGNQAQSGIRLQVIETQRENSMDSELNLQTNRAKLEDLDYAKAITQFEQMKVALQAAQQTFVQTKDLSLFNYI